MWYENLGINILSAAMGSLVVYYFCYSNYYLKLSRIRITIFILVFGIINGFASSFFVSGGDLLNILKPIILLLLSTAIIKLLFKIRMYQVLISFFIYLICLGVGNSLVPLLINISSNELTTSNIISNPVDYLIVNVLSNLIAYIIIFAIKPLRDYFARLSMNKATLPILFITFLILTANFGMHFYIKIFNFNAFIIISTLSVLYCIYIIIVSSSLLKQETAKIELEQQKFYNESLNGTLFNLRRFKHDWSNNLTVINSMLSMNKIDELKQYMSELINQNQDEGNTAIYNIKNAGLFSIISNKLNQARDLGVSVDLSVMGEIDSIPGIKVSELCEVLGIFLDNAIEETCKGEKNIKLYIFNDNKYLEISVSNSCTAEPDIKKIYEQGYSSKGEGRGMGLPIVKKIIGKYKNIMHQTDFESKIFTQTITIEKGL